MADTNELQQRFWQAFGGLLHGQPREPRTVQEWIDAGTRLKALTQLDALATRLEAVTKQPTATPQTRQRAPERDSIYYDAQGQACCPVHEKPLKQGKFGWFCSCKDPNGRNGYCDYRAKEV